MSEFSYRATRRVVLSMAGLGLYRGAAAVQAARVLRVGPGQAVKSLAGAARAARDGMVIEVEAGDYVGDVATWSQNDLILRAVGGRVRLIAAGASAQGKGIFVTRGERMRIEGFDFIGARVPDLNGAGIRLEAGSLKLFDCAFRDNEQGLLSSNDARVRLEMENCDFGAVRSHGGVSHNLYVGRIGFLRVIGCYFHHGHIGHLLKSRAAVSQILYSRLTDEIGGEASYELEFPDGGQALVVGNVIQQSAGTQNRVMVSFGAEGYIWPRQELLMASNTLVDLFPAGGRYLRVAPGNVRVQLVNNLMAVNRRLPTNSAWDVSNNSFVSLKEFVDGARGDYRLRADSPLRGKAVDPGNPALRPSREYRHPHDTVALNGPIRNAGAFQMP